MGFGLVSGVYQYHSVVERWFIDAVAAVRHMEQCLEKMDNFLTLLALPVTIHKQTAWSVLGGIQIKLRHLIHRLTEFVTLPEQSPALVAGVARGECHCDLR